jgi:hypothetical protein
MHKSTRLTAAIATALALTGIGVGLLAAPANALPPPCYPDCTPSPTPTPTPTVTTIYSLSTNGGWSGDTVTATGIHFTGATVTVNNLPATVTAETDANVTFTIPLITSTVVGPVSIPIAITSSHGTATAPFTLTGALQLPTLFSAFNNEQDGYSYTSVSADRSVGWVNMHVDLTNYQYWNSLSINYSAVWLDANGTVIGYTAPQNGTAPGVFYSWPNSPSTKSVDFTTTIGPDPTRGPWIHSGQIVVVRDHATELLNALSNAYGAGQNIQNVLSELSGFMH